MGNFNDTKKNGWSTEGQENMNKPYLMNELGIYWVIHQNAGVDASSINLEVNMLQYGM